MLRHHPKDLYDRFADKNNKFSTTVHVLVSAVVKLAREMRVASGLRLFRGLGSASDLPDSFHQADAMGRRGFMEWGFMSTTSDEQVARQVRGRVPY